MRITIEVDCSPEEARRFLGLPDISAANEALGDKIRAAMVDIDAETVARDWTKAAMSGMEDLQKTFWQGFAASAGKGGKTEKD